jgi:hypothetical protein
MEEKLGFWGVLVFGEKEWKWGNGDKRRRYGGTVEVRWWVTVLRWWCGGGVTVLRWWCGGDGRLRAAVEWWFGGLGVTEKREKDGELYGGGKKMKGKMGKVT